MTDLDQNATAPDAIAAAVVAWEDPPRVPSAGAAPVLSVDGFEGPLDWLLEMVRARQIDLARLSVVALVEAFAGAMDTALARQDNAPAQLVRWGDWLVMAATLAHLRSRLLLPADAPEAKAAVDEAEALRRQL
ncbi:MAG TPA: segregation/condensation protein A, partial [Acetobacteraceae bacterium]